MDNYSNLNGPTNPQSLFIFKTLVRRSLRLPVPDKG